MNKLLITAFLVLMDQASKLFVLKKFHQSESFPVIRDIFHITLVYNTGSAFGLLQNQKWFLVYISVFAIIIILSMLVRSARFTKIKYHFIWQISLVLILSGATGNLIDRIKLGYVIDFLDFRIWPVFNFADSFITIGVGLLAFLFFKKDVFIEEKKCNIL